MGKAKKLIIGLLSTASVLSMCIGVNAAATVTRTSSTKTWSAGGYNLAYYGSAVFVNKSDGTGYTYLNNGKLVKSSGNATLTQGGVTNYNSYVKISGYAMAPNNQALLNATVYAP